MFSEADARTVSFPAASIGLTNLARVDQEGVYHPRAEGVPCATVSCRRTDVLTCGREYLGCAIRCAWRHWWRTFRLCCSVSGAPQPCPQRLRQWRSLSRQCLPSPWLNYLIWKLHRRVPQLLHDQKYLKWRCALTAQSSAHVLHLWSRSSSDEISV